jgi:hypothetical protein
VDLRKVKTLLITSSGGKAGERLKETLGAKHKSNPMLLPIIEGSDTQKQNEALVFRAIGQPQLKCIIYYRESPSDIIPQVVSQACRVFPVIYYGIVKSRAFK